MTASRFRALVRRNEAHAKAMRGDSTDTDGQMSREEFRQFLAQSGYGLPTTARKPSGV